MAIRNRIVSLTVLVCVAGAMAVATAAETLDLAEVKAAAAEHFDKLNKDGDSTLEAKEVKGVLGEKAFKAADPDNDGTLSKEEYLALVEKLFKKADPDHDGTLDVTELKSKSGVALRKLIG